MPWGLHTKVIRGTRKYWGEKMIQGVLTKPTLCFFNRFFCTRASLSVRLFPGPLKHLNCIDSCGLFGRVGLWSSGWRSGFVAQSFCPPLPPPLC